jgi:lysophospholipase L1-like esterase
VTPTRFCAALLWICLLAAEAGALRIVAVGDSITAGSAGVGWAHLLAQALPEHEFENVAVHGTFAIGWRPDKPGSQWHKRLRQALPADVVTVMLGTNDAAMPVMPTHYEQAMRAIVDGLLAEGVRCVWLLTPPPSLGPGAAREPWLRLYRERLAKLAGERREPRAGSVGLIGIHDALDAGHLEPDGIHPNARGHAEIARLVRAGLALSGCGR